MTRDFGKDFFEAMEAMRKEEALKQELVDNVINIVDGFKRIKNSKVKAEIPVDQIRQLEETMPEFAEETQSGFTAEQTKRIVIELADYFFEQMKLERLEKSLSFTLFKIKVKNIDFSACTGAALYEYMLEKDMVKELCTPDFKKRCMVAAAMSLTVEKGNITFNTAMRRIINKCRTDKFVEEEIEESKQDLVEICETVNPIIEWYLENETEILQWIMK